MKCVILLILNFSVSGVLFAQVQCNKECLALIEKCVPKKLEILSPNRFLKCGNETLIIPANDPSNKKLTPTCKVASLKALQEIADIEKSGNNCKTSSDCLAVSMLEVPYYINKALEPSTHLRISSIVNEASKSCPLAPMFTLRSKVSAKDLAFPFHFTCEENKCIPQYKGEKIDWFDRMQKIMDVELSK